MAHIRPSLHSSLGGSVRTPTRGVKWTLQLAPESLSSICARELSVLPYSRTSPLSAGPVCWVILITTYISLSHRKVISQQFFFFFLTLHPPAMGPFLWSFSRYNVSKEFLDVSSSHIQFKELNQFKESNWTRSGDYKKYQGFSAFWLGGGKGAAFFCSVPNLGSSTGRLHHVA